MTYDAGTPIHTAIQKAIDITYPIFQHHGWTYSKNPQPPPRRILEETLNQLTKTLQQDPDTLTVSSGRYTITKIRENDETIYEYHLDLSNTWT